MTDRTKVYILGAGCSVAYGYPLGGGFMKQLEAFGKSLVAPERQRIKCAVESTVDLLTSRGIQTLDELVARINSGVFDEKRSSSLETERVRFDRIYDAKVATVALFIELESAASRTGLAGYTSFLREILPGHDHWQQLLQRADCRILTFNYDRLFEMAFLNLFHPDTGALAFYGSAVLNSGLSVVQKKLLAFEPNRFCFLKLHGSIGMSARDEHGEPAHYHDCEGPVPDAASKLVDDNFFPRLPKNPNDFKPEPLIVFPHEKTFVQSNDNNGFPFRLYIKAVWEHANRVVADASEIWIIGYSFSPIDRLSFLRLLSNAKSCKRIIVQNPEATELCKMLRKKCPDLGLPLEPYDSKF